MSGRSTRLAVISVGALLMTAGLAGCGSSESDDYLASAGDICSGSNDEITAAQNKANTAVGAGDTKTAAEATGEIEKIATRQIEELQALDPPEGEEDTLNEFIVLFEDFRDILAKQEKALGQADAKAYNATLNQQQSLLTQMDTAAAEAGAEGCESEAS